MADIPTASLVSPEFSEIREFKEEVKGENNIDEFNARFPYELYVRGAADLKNRDSLDELRRYSQEPDLVVALYHLDSDMTQKEAEEDMGREEVWKRSDEVVSGMLEYFLSMFPSNDLEKSEPETRIDRRFGTLENYLEEDWKTRFEGYGPEIYTKRFDAEIANLDGFFDILEVAEKIIDQSQRYETEAFGFSMDADHVDSLEQAYEGLDRAAEANIGYTYGEGKRGVFWVNNNTIGSQMADDNFEEDIELVEKVRREI